MHAVLTPTGPAGPQGLLHEPHGCQPHQQTKVAGGIFRQGDSIVMVHTL